MRILTLTSLFPGSAQPRHGTFVRERLAAWQQRHGGVVHVVSPVPWVPRCLAAAVPERYAAFARTPRREHFGGFAIEHPRYPMIPKVGVPAQGILYEYGARSTVRRLLRDESLDLIDAHYAYPDGFAAALLAAKLRKPLVLTVRGTDVNLLPSIPSLARQIRFALARADRVVAVAANLAELAVAAGADPERVRVLRNGVDCAKFAPQPREASRKRCGATLDRDRRVIATVGFLVPRKGHALLLDALSRIEAARRPQLLIAGDGPERARLAAQVEALGLAADVVFLGPTEHEDVAHVFSAADVSVLASDREGWPNVLLESMACGTPVVATAVNGVPEVVSDPKLGVLVHERTPAALAAAIEMALARDFDRHAIRASAEAMDWSATADGLEATFREACEANAGASR
jgi:teichuronic acid biosynthesis glycosyltransferase TuaC